MEDVENEPVRCILCPKAFANEAALHNHVKLEHVEAYESGDCSMWVLIDEDSNDFSETDMLSCLLCSKGFTNELALQNHAKLVHSDAFETGDKTIWMYEKASKHQSNTKKLRKGNYSKKECKQKDPKLGTVLSYEQTNAIVFVDIKREDDDTGDSNYSLPVETMIEENSNVDSVGAFVELPTDSEGLAEESNQVPTKSPGRTAPKKLSTKNKIINGTHKKPEDSQDTATSDATKTITKQFKCLICHRKFNQLNNLDRHYRTHTKEKPYECDTCHKSFTQLNNLERHNKIHSLEKQFECEVCKKCFNQKNNLERHFRTHTSEKPFQCLLCEKRFSQKNNLNRHFRCHTGEEQFTCLVCKRGFNQKENLDRHMRIHDSKKPYYHQRIKKIV